MTLQSQQYSNKNDQFSSYEIILISVLNTLIHFVFHINIAMKKKRQELSTYFRHHMLYVASDRDTKIS